MEKRFSVLLVALSIVFGGCLTLEGDLNASAEGLGSFNVSINESLDNSSLDVSQVVNRVIPDNATVCVYGGDWEGYSRDYFGSVSVFDKSVGLETVLLNQFDRSDVYSNCSVIVVRGSEDGRFLPLSHRKSIVKQVSRGAGLIIMGAGGTRDPEDSSVLGWDAGGLTDLIGVRADLNENKDPELLGGITLNGRIYRREENPVFLNQPDLIVSQGLRLTFVAPEDRTHLVALVREVGEDSPSSPVYYGILSACSISHPCTYYFAFDAFDSTPVLLVNAVQYLASESLGKYLPLKVIYGA